MALLGIIYLSVMVTASLGVSNTFSIPVSLTNPSDYCPSSAQLPSFAESLAPYRSGLERLVVFIYRKIGTNELITFVPSGEFQNCIQDYPETKENEIYNVHTITTETLFKVTKNKVIRLKPEIPFDIIDDVPSPIDETDRPWEIIGCTNCVPNPADIVENIDLPTEILDFINPFPLLEQNFTEQIQGTDIIKETNDEFLIGWDSLESSNTKPLISGGVIESIIPPISPSQQSGNLEVVLEVDGVSGQVSNDVPQVHKEILHIPSEFQPPTLPQEEFITENDYYPPRKIIDILPNPEIQQTPEQPNFMYYPPLEQWVLDGSQDITDSGSITFPSDQEYVAPSINRPPSSLVQFVPGKENVANLPPQWQLLNIPVQNPTEYQAKEYAWAIKFPNFDLTPIKQGQQGKLKALFKPRLKVNNISKQTFDSWLLAQLNNFKELPDGNVDINLIKREIEQALKVNGFRLTSDGVLVDASGAKSSLSNLKLRPLLIGKSFPYDRLLTEAHGKYKRPATPLIEGLLLTLINPARVLGLVTLGVTALPHDRNKRIYHTVKEWNVNYKKELPKIEKFPHNFILTSPVRSNGHGFSGSVEIGTPVPPVLSGFSVVGDGYVGSEELEGPGFRIIGGSSATGTGTPLASKGRSGVEEDEGEDEYEYMEE